MLKIASLPCAQDEFKLTSLKIRDRDKLMLDQLGGGKIYLGFALLMDAVRDDVEKILSKQNKSLKKVKRKN